MKTKPILFSGEMVRAILEGRKSQTRRVIKPEWSRCLDLDDPEDAAKALEQCPYGQPGDRLWVRETWLSDGGVILYRADMDDVIAASWRGHWRPSIFMPRSAARLWLEVTAVRVERLQEIGHDDACVEGAPSEPHCCGDYGTGSIYVDWFAETWDRINAKRGFGWDVNPWVWVVEFSPDGGRGEKLQAIVDWEEERRKR